MLRYRPKPKVEKGLSTAERMMTLDLKVDKDLYLCHMLSRTAFDNEKYRAVSDTLTFCVQLNGQVNSGPWAQIEKTDKLCAEGRRVMVMTGICGGQFHKNPSQNTACRTIFLPTKLYRMRLVRYGEAWRATAICLENSPPTGKHFPDDYHLTMERDTVGVEFLAEITSVNGVELAWPL